MAEKILFVYNPRAGKGQIKNNLLDIIDILTKAGYEVTAYPTQSAGDAIRAVKERRKGFHMIVCSGGDGTLDEVVHGMLQSGKKLPIGYIPAGSTNDFANSLGLPKNMKKAAEVAANGTLFPCDAGVLNEESFVYVAAFGIFTNISYETKQDVKNILGHTAYLLEGLKSLSSIKSYPLKITYDDVCLEEEFLYGMITNSTSVGGFKGITGKNIELNDGLFEVTLIRKPTNPLELNNMVAALVDKKIHSDFIHCFKTSHIVIESETPLPWTLDGEFGGEHQKAVIDNIQKVIEIRVPQN